MDQPLVIEIWSDVVCPWCYIGKRRFDRAVGELCAEWGGETREYFDIRYRAYQLDPNAPGHGSGRPPVPVSEAYARKFGGPEQAAAIIDRVSSIAAAEGIEFHMDRALRANTFDAHRLLWLAEQPDSAVDQQVLAERLLRAYFSEGVDIGDRSHLARCAAEVGLDSETTLEFLDSDRGTDEVRFMLREASDLGISGVPAYVIDRSWNIPGAQDTDVFVQALRRLVERRG